MVLTLADSLIADITAFRGRRTLRRFGLPERLRSSRARADWLRDNLTLSRPSGRRRTDPARPWISRRDGSLLETVGRAPRAH